MSDIVKRLRSRQGFFKNGGIWLMSTSPDDDCHEAADENERLRAALEWYAAGKGMWDKGQRAREALKDRR